MTVVSCVGLSVKHPGMSAVVGMVAGSMGAVWLAWKPEERTMAWVQTALLLAIFIAFIGYKSWRFRKWATHCEQGAALLDAGDLGAAQRALEDADGYALRPPERVLTRFHLGLCALFQGHVDAARSTLLALSRGWRTKEVPDVYVRAPDMLAACLALQGDLVEARHWLEEAHRRRRLGVASFSFGELLILCREERYGATVRLLDDRREAIEKSGVLVRKLLRVVRAFSWDALATEGRGTPGEELKSLEPVRHGEFNYLGARWPEMKIFLDAQGAHIAAARTLEDSLETSDGALRVFSGEITGAQCRSEGKSDAWLAFERVVERLEAQSVQRFEAIEKLRCLVRELVTVDANRASKMREWLPIESALACDVEEPARTIDQYSLLAGYLAAQLNVPLPSVFDAVSDSLAAIDVHFWNENLPESFDIWRIDEAVVPVVGAFLGEVLVRRLGGQWVPRARLEESQVRVGDSVCLPFVRAYRYMRSRQALREHSLAQFYVEAELRCSGRRSNS